VSLEHKWVPVGQLLSCLVGVESGHFSIYPMGMAGYGRSRIESLTSLKGGCCFALLLFGLLLAARIAYVEISDRRAVVSAKRRCTQEHVLQVRQPAVWHGYLRKLPPTEPFGSFILEKSRVQAAMGLHIGSFGSGDDHGFILSNTRGEVARITYVSAISRAFSIEGARTLLYTCAQQHPSLYRYGAAI
jgi:hypothetical protein